MTDLQLLPAIIVYLLFGLTTAGYFFPKLFQRPEKLSAFVGYIILALAWLALWPVFSALGLWILNLDPEEPDDVYPY